MNRSTATELPSLTRMAKILSRTKDGILSYFNHLISSQEMEDANEKIKMLQRHS
ncbi:transposase [Allorhodopirellula solitaria]|uniref:Transposase IS204/IS1001/IS1096/IS1165 DDE domain-containing protein n=1 Tax=Allorhodopirellula solitaria TaxID=2527987 RepID=A0A5C5XV47_9BACT|nr:transposase [Allorhodopirellula solitaria]TWT67157.1 hypothetical protein CA85_20060 [Allorhodopirellula solitaria]